MASDSFLFDATRCTNCGACVMACREANHHPAETPHDVLSDKSFLAIETKAGRHVRKSCMHCLTPTCASVCPVGALQATESGAVTYDKERCMGCRYCMMACPFSVPRYEWSSTTPYLRKCEFCLDKRRAGNLTPCASVCNTGALVYGDRPSLLEVARQRIAGGGYIKTIYGEEEAGGTSLLILSDRPFAELGFPENIPKYALPELTWNVLHAIPAVVSVCGVGLAGLGWIIARREKLRGEHHA